VAAIVAGGCGSTHHAQQDRAPKHAARPSARAPHAGTGPRPSLPAQRVLGLPPVAAGPLPGYLLIADRNNNRVLIVSPSKHVVWQATGLRGPDDAFFTPRFRSVITNEEFNDTLTELSLKTHARIWRYGHDAIAGSARGYLNTPDDAYRLRSGATTVADIRNCRIVELSATRKVRRILGGSCTHDPPRGFASPNGDTPLPDGGLLVTEIGPPGWIDRISPDGRLLWSIASPIAYPSDAQLLPDGRVLVASFTNPGRIVEVMRSGRVTWSFGARSGRNELNKPSLAVRLPNGLIAANDDYNERAIVIDPRSKRIVWQFGHTATAGRAPGYLDKPDGLDLLPSAVLRAVRPHSVARARRARFVVRTVGTLPGVTTKAAAVALGSGRIALVGGIVDGTFSDRVLSGIPRRLRTLARLPSPTHDAAAVARGSDVFVYGGGEATSSADVVRVDTRTGAATPLRPLDEPLSDLGAAVVHGRTYLVGGYTGSRYASAILRAGRGDSTAVVARLPAGLRYAGVAVVGRTVYIAGGVTIRGASAAVYAFTPGGGVRRIATLPAPEAHAALVALGKAVYLIGGTHVLRIDPATRGVARVATLPKRLTDPAAVAVGHRIVVLGGGTRDILEISPR